MESLEEDLKTARAKDKKVAKRLAQYERAEEWADTGQKSCNLRICWKKTKLFPRTVLANY